ncbi:ABC transporter permease [Corynebacterium kozikiae]|uniref:ABC transporter permease n=1 Tax=Corynebacterium kozikiae TaxID=2968469 RepID=UPI00211B961A|nr:ABC transporter permease [Corynebacterium sp. 76QC2CO]MCQ9343784.1 ABC transporter permease [Corynebacterium sp. 76QC2CO]
MFLAIREIRVAKGRFALIGTVVTMITFLLVMLTGLTTGLGHRNISALEELNPQAVVFNQEVSFNTSSISEEILAELGGVPLGASQSRMETDTNADAVAVLGLPEGTESPHGTIGKGALVSETLAENLGAQPGQTVLLGGVAVPVDSVVPDEYYSHGTVVWVNTETWQAVSRSEDVGTVLLLESEPTNMPENIFVTDLKGSFDGLPAYGAQKGSLQAMQGFLYLISAVVTVSFLTVWTLQRTKDIAILAALGANKRYLLKDALGQAAIVLAIGAVLGAALATGIGMLMGQAVPFILHWQEVVLTALAVWVLGLVGAGFATRQVTKVDPQIALNA